MRVLLDTNILIHREARTVLREDIGTLFRWLDRLGYEKCIHPASLDEIRKHADPEVVRTLQAKLGSYVLLRTIAPDTAEITPLRTQDKTANDTNDTSLLAEVVAGRVDFLISEDRGIHRKAVRLSVVKQVFTIHAFLEKAIAENPELTDYKLLSVRKQYFGQLNLSDPFFDSFKADYPDFVRWFNRKADEIAYTCTAESGDLLAFLYLKRETPKEDYSDISPRFDRAYRLKIGTFRLS